MDGGSGMMGFVIEKDRNAVGCAYPNTNTRDIGDEGIHAFKVISHTFPGNGLLHPEDFGAMNLMGHKDLTDA